MASQDPLDFDLSGTAETSAASAASATPALPAADPQASTAAFQDAVRRRMIAEREARAARSPRPLAPTERPSFVQSAAPAVPPPIPFAATLPMTLGSLALSLVLEAAVYGWPFAIGLTGMLFVHECGHAVAARRFRRPYGGMYFMPFIGAAVRLRGRSGGLAEEATIGVMGPIFGGAAGLALLASFFVFPLPMLLFLAKISFAINFINLMPVPPLDGSWIAPIFAKSGRGGQDASTPVSPATRLRFALLYGGLMALLVAAFFWSDSLGRH